MTFRPIGVGGKRRFRTISWEKWPVEPRPECRWSLTAEAGLSVAGFRIDEAFQVTDASQSVPLET